MSRRGGAGRGSRRRTRPRAVILVRRDGRLYWRNLDMCRVMLLQRQIEGIDTVTKFARLAGVSTSTVYDWMRGATPGTEETTRRILATLRVNFNDVHTQLDGTPVENGPAEVLP